MPLTLQAAVIFLSLALTQGAFAKCPDEDIGANGDETQKFCFYSRDGFQIPPINCSPPGDTCAPTVINPGDGKTFKLISTFCDNPGSFDPCPTK
ncbi:hypothetical protein LZ30DRAFT_723277 [Colletotrichum cereale]|nr:hypothetical protein LZ30DRAFT_723277 [Colletotrichum cereale]